jgi:hypothetical protein
MKITEDGTKWEYVEAQPFNYSDITFVTNSIGFATTFDGISC